MKRTIFPTLILVVILIITGCKKDSFDPSSVGLSDFSGTWSGTLTTFKNNKLMKEQGLFLIYPAEGGASMEAIIYARDTRVFRQFQFQGGTLYFKVVNPDPANPTCQNWNLGGYVSFADEKTLSIRISGNECGLIGSEFVDWSGSLVKSSATMDSLPCFTFAKTGNNWSYVVTKATGDTCELQKLIGSKSGSYYFGGESTHSCGWPMQNIPLKWTVSPSEFTIREDLSLTRHEIYIPVYAKYGVTYRSYPYPDTVTLTLTDTNLYITTVAGNFFCNKYRYTESSVINNVRNTRISDIWLDHHNGIIRQEVTSPNDTSDIIRQVLKTKSFQGN